jgi:hypothetical protein
MRALAASLGVFGLGKWAQAEEPVFKYSKFFRRCDEATMDEFRNFVVIGGEGKAHKVPFIWATDDWAEAYIKQSMDGDVIRLPLMNIYRGDLFFNENIYSYYHLSMRSYYEEDMNQMLEQAVIKFHPKFKNKVGEYSLLSMINNYYPGGSHKSTYPLAECHPIRGEIHSAAKWGQQGEWVTFKKGDMVEGTPRLPILKHQLNMIVVLDGKP